MIYICEKCKFTFQRVSVTDKCPDCGREYIREANDKEKTEFVIYQSEFVEED